MPDAADTEKRDAPGPGEEGAPPDGDGGGGGGPRWGRRIGLGLGALALLLAVAVAGGVAWGTRTDAGREAVTSWVESAVEGAVRGRVEIGEVTGGNLLTRAEISSFSIREPDGEPFVVLEDVRAEYDPLAFLRGRYVFRGVRLGRARLVLSQDEDGDWNFDRLFADDDTAAVDTAGDEGGTHLSLHDVRVDDGRVEVRTDFEAVKPDSEEVWRLERTPEGRVVRTIEIDSLSGRFPRLRIADPTEPMLLDLEAISGRALAVRQALPVREADVRAVFRDTIRVEIGGMRVGRSSLAGRGWVSAEDPPQYRFDLRAEPFSFEDLQWIPVPTPATGGGPADLTVRSVGEDLAVDVRNGDITIADSRVRGALTVVTAETPRLDTLDVELAPLRLSRVDRILDRPTAVDGYVEGPVRGGGPISDLRLSGDLTVRDTAGGGPPSALRLDGGVSLVEPNPVHDLRLQLEEFEPKWAAIVTIRPEIGGRASGSLLLDGSPEDSMSFEADLTHRAPTDSVSRIRARGLVADYGDRALRLDLEVSPLSLDAADAYLPRVGLRGAVRGSLRTSGDLSRLRTTAELSSARGDVAVDGTFGLTTEPVTYDARVEARRIQLRDWLDRAPYTRLGFRGRVQGVGTEPGDLEAEFDLDVLPSLVEGAVVDTSHLRFSIDEGLATVDSFDIRSDVGRIRGRGAFGLEAGRSGSLVLTATVPELSSWNRWLVPGRNPVEEDTSVADLFEGFPDSRAATGPGVEADDEARADTLAGQLDGRGVVYGNVEDFAAGGMVRADSVSYGGSGADSLTVTMDLYQPEGLDSLVARGDAWGVEAGDVRLDSLGAGWTRRGPGDNSYRIYAGRDTTLQVESSGSIGWEEQRKALRADSLRLKLGPQELSLERPTVVAWGEEGLEVDTLRLAGGRGARLTADGELHAEGSVRFDLQMRDIETELAHLLFPDETPYGGSVDGGLQVRGTGEEPEMSGFLTVSQPRYAGVDFDSLTLNADYRRGTVTFNSEIRGRPAEPVLTADGTVQADLSLQAVEDRIPEEPVDVRVTAEDLPLRVVGLMTESLEDIQGVARGQVQVTGSPGSFRYRGRLEAVDLSTLVPSLGVRYGTDRGVVRFQGAQAALDSLILSSSGGGSLTTTGTIGLATLSNPALDLTVSARKLRAVERREMSLLVDGTGQLTGTYEEPSLQGDARVSNGEVQVTRFTRQGEVVDLTDPDAYSLIDTTFVGEQQLLREMQNPFLQNLRVEAQLRVGPGLWIRSEELDVEVAGELRVRMQPDQELLQLFGPLRLVRGQYRVSPQGTFLQGTFTRQLQITDGTIEFVGTPGVNPNLNVTAVYRARGPNGAPITITANVGGTLINKTLTLSSDAQISQSDQICYLLFSAPCVSVAGGAGQGLAGGGLTQTLQEQLLGSVGSQITSLLVADTWLDYATVQTGGLYGNGGGAGQTDFLSSSFLSQTEVEAGKYLGQNLFVSITQPLGSRLPGATLEWQFRQDWTLEARTENRFGRGMLTLGSDALNAQRMWGLFLFREWGF